MERLMGSFRDRFQFLLFTIRLSFLKIMTLMSRLHGTFYSVVFMGLSAIQGVNNVANNDLIKFIMEFCFTGDTPIQLLDGNVKPISELQIGDKLQLINGVSPTVTSLFKFDGRKTKMVNINGVKVSSKHYVHYDKLNIWIESENHPDAAFCESEKVIYCLNTDTHTLLINGLLFTDYDESSESSVIHKTKQISLSLLNNGQNNICSKNEGDDYDLGFSKNALIYLKDGRLVPIIDIKLGDVIIGGGTVLGTVTEKVSSAVKIGNLGISTSQLLWDALSNKWVRAGILYKSNIIQFETPEIYHHLIVSNNIIIANGFYFRDYREVTDTDMETEYSKNLCNITSVKI
jgi:hypothetical protein